jgi:4'-phosphopantetheinyl transferase EntD
VLAPILPPGVVSQEHFGEPSGGPLFPAEEPAVAHAVDSRRREFATVRCLARVCLGRLGLPAAPIVPGAGGAPVWPSGVCGSLTHCDGYAGAALACADRVRAIGIDAEPDAPLPEGVLALIATPVEMDRLAGCPADEGSPCWDRLLFSAKEAVFKVWSPLTGEWLEPTDTGILLDPHRGTFTAHLPGDGLPVRGRPVRTLLGRWARDHGILQTAVVVR